MTAADAIALCRAERSKRAGRVSAQLEEVRAIVARLESQDEQRKKGGRPTKTGEPVDYTIRAKRARQSAAAKTRKRESVTREAKPKSSRTHFRCGHERIAGNIYSHPGRVVRGKQRKSYDECKTCQLQRNEKRRQSRHPDFSTTDRRRDQRVIAERIQARWRAA